MSATTFDFVLMTVCGWVNRRQLAAIAYLREERSAGNPHAAFDVAGAGDGVTASRTEA